MKILVLCNKPPYPPRDGGSFAMKTMIDGLLKAGHQVKVLAVNAPKYGVSVNDISNVILERTSMELMDVDLSIKALPALLCLLQRKSYQVRRFYDKAFAERLREVLQQGFDIVQIETVFPGVYLEEIRRSSKAKVILRAHNIEHKIWEHLYENESSHIKKWYLRKVAGSLKSFELKLFSSVDGIAAITHRDKAFIELQTCKTPVITCNFGIDPSEYPSFTNAEPQPSLFHLAAMDWQPNIEGIRWFLQQVWPRVLEKRPACKLYLAGKNMPAWIGKERYQNVVVVGEVKDSWEFITQQGIMIVPLFSGSGVRIKIIEGMLAAKAIVSTTTGASGIECTHGQNILLADDPLSFSDAIISCINNPEMAVKLGNMARNYIIQYHDIKNIIPPLTDFYKYLSD
jgi:glycosyltransferase involved in cell wall biosynthesis